MAIFKKKKSDVAEEKPAAEKSKSTAPRVKRSVSVLSLRTILAPLATEKSAHLADRGVYVFLVAKDANRVAVRQAFRELYNVTPVSVNVVNVRGTARRFGRSIGRTSDSKKALITVPKGTHINVFSAV